MKITRGNFRVEVEPRNPGDFKYASISGQTRTEEESISICEEIADDIRRHVDNLPYNGNRGVSVIWDEEKVCEHCGSEWNPTCFGNDCCDKDIEENGLT